MRCSQCSRRLADLLGQLAPAALERALALLVELARRQLEQVGLAGRLARLAHEPDAARRRARRSPTDAGMRDPLARDLLAVLVAEACPRGRRRPCPRRRCAPPARSKRELMAPHHDARGLVEQREADVEHPLQRGDADALGRLVVVLGAVGEVDALDALDRERVGVRPAAGDDPARLVAARAQRGLGGDDGRRRALRAVAVEELLADDVDVASAAARAVVDARRSCARPRPRRARGRASAPRPAGGSARARRWSSRRRRGSSRRSRSSARRAGRAASRRSRARRRGSRCGRPRGGCRRAPRGRGTRRRAR